MSETKWTKSQLEAIETNKSTIVSASAGTGKTAVLTERVVRQVLKGVDISNILVMTFSAKAADEMKTRIADKLKAKLDELEAAPASKTNFPQKKWIYSQLNSMGNAPIQTIHSFCNDIIKSNCYLVDVDPKFKVATGADAAVIRKQAADLVLADEYENASEAFNKLFDYIDGMHTVEDVLINSYKSLMSILNGFDWLSAEIEKYNIDCSVIPDFAKEILLSDFKKALSMYEAVNTELEAIRDEKLAKPLLTIHTDMNVLKTAISHVESGNIAAINPYLFSNFGNTIRLSDEYAEEKAIRAAARDLIVSNYKAHPFYLDRQLARVKDMYPFAKYFESLLLKFRDKYSELKKNQNVIDFNDMEQLAYKILQNPLVANSYRTSFFAVYVDEYQDTSPIQEEIINSVSQPNNLFCVGDLKQSIYRFRSSDPILFKDRMSSYEGKSSKKIISLNYNFRSSANVLNCANDVFRCIAPSSKEISYGEGDILVCGRGSADEEAPVIVDLINISSGEDKDTAEIANIVKIIKNRVGKPIYDSRTNTTRPAEYRDFAILSRKVLKYTNMFNEIFTQNGIPFEVERTGELFEAVEVMTLIALLQLIVNRNNDLNILTVMHQGVFGFTDEDILAVRAVDGQSSYISNIKSLAESESDGLLNRKCREMIGFLNLCCEKQHLYSLSRLVAYVIDRTYLNDLFAVKSNGAHRIDNLRLFISFASEYEHKSHKKLYSFLKYVHDVTESGESVGEAQNITSSNCVKVTTIHKSKGLEYPIVILAFMNKEFSDIGKKAPVIIDRDAGIGFRYFDHENRVRCGNLLRTHVENRVMEKNKEEEMRLLYVAMTRAKEELYIQGIAPLKQIEKENCSSMMDWILMSAYNCIDTEDGPKFVSSGEVVGKWALDATDSSSLEEYLVPQDNFTAESIPEIDFTDAVPVRKHIDKPTPIPKSTSASVLTSINKYDRSSFAMPDFMTTNHSAEQGDSVHKFLRYALLVPDMTAADVKAVIDDLVVKGTISTKDRDNITQRIINGIAKMTASELFSNMMMSNNVLKEKSLYTSMNSSEFIESDESHDMLVRCIVDIAYETDEGYVIADYKTDYVTESSLPDAIKSHKPQLDMYAKCFEKVFGKPIVGVYLIMLSIGQVCRVS